jgi:hypothetical protein
MWVFSPERRLSMPKSIQQPGQLTLKLSLELGFPAIVLSDQHMSYLHPNAFYLNRSKLSALF